MILEYTHGEYTQLPRYYGLGYIGTVSNTAAVAIAVVVASLQEALHVHFVNQATVTDVVGNRIFWLRAPQETTFPYVTYMVTSDPHVPFAFGRTDAGQAVVRVNTYHKKSKVGALRIAGIVRDSINQFTGTVQGLTMEAVYCDRPQSAKVFDQNAYVSGFNMLVQYDDV